MEIVKTEEVKFEDLSAISYRVFLNEYLRTDVGSSRVNILAIKFVGTHGIGSEGNNDSLFMATIIRAAMNIWYVDGLILDLKELRYEWGNSIADVMLAGKSVLGRKFPTVALVSELCEPALKSAQGFYASESQSGGQLKWLFEDLDSATSYLEEQIAFAAGQDSGSRKRSILAKSMKPAS